ncbi:MAG: diphosphomevalonate decarboxylase [Saprospiraceae bacterium]|nr:diphosphomevalonate decarboxylase [Saprospiraceae bacterium]
MLDYINPKLVIERGSLSPGKVTWKSPSNIALVKYWGKHGTQLPQNPSISLTLDQAHTITSIAYEAIVSPKEDISLDFFFDDQPNAVFGEKVKNFFKSLLPIFPFLGQLHLTVHSTNSFPHSAGIASSASSMSAIAMCLCDLENLLFGTLNEKNTLHQKASYIARLGSGSASRSIYPIAGIWGEMADVHQSSDLYAIPAKEMIHQDFHDFHDDILIVSKKEKSVSSRAGHQLMENNMYATTRYLQARQHMQKLLAAMQSGDLETFGKITEKEALTLHALMMASSPPFILMEPNTIEIIHRIRDWRNRTKNPLYFTLDAGPNVHLLYPKKIFADVQSFIQDALLPFCENGHVIRDQVGPGPTQL